MVQPLSGLRRLLAFGFGHQPEVMHGAALVRAQAPFGLCPYLA